MKITIFGLTLSSSWGNGHATPYRAILRALARRGHEITFYEKDVHYYAARRDFDRCDFCNLILYREWADVRSRALAEAAESDVVINASYCPNGARIIDDVLTAATPVHIFYDLDTPITISKLEKHGAVDYLRRDQIPHFDLYLSFTGGSLLRELETQWRARCARALYGCVDPDVYRRTQSRLDFECVLSYMGTYAADRQRQLDDLFLEPARRMRDSQFLLAGSLYPYGWSWPENVRHMEHVAPADHPALYSSSAATLNITRAGMARTGYCPSGRFFEAAACGTPIVSDYFEGLETFFTPEEELVIARCADDVVAALSRTDALNPIAQRARERTLDEHTGDRRAEQLLRYLEEASSSSKRFQSAEKAGVA